MPSVNTPFIDTLSEAPRLCEELAERVQSELDGRSKGDRAITRVSVSVPRDVDLLGWMRAQRASEGVYWSPRDPEATLVSANEGRPAVGRSEEDHQQTVAAVGAADVVLSATQPIQYEQLERALATRFQACEVESRYYGGLRFDAPQSRTTRGTGAPWGAFGTYRFVLPRFELRDIRGGLTLTCNLVLPRDAGRTEAIVEAIHRLVFPTSVSPESLPKPLGRTDRPTEDGWSGMVQWALQAISDGALAKVVLARQVALELGQPLDPLLVLHHLKAATPRCFHFAVRPAGATAFLGASPERLFRRTGRRVVSEAVAGTRGRGETPEADAALREELLNSSKERREHAFVQDAIREALETLCTSVEGSASPSDLALARGRHLHARLTGHLRSDASTVDLLDRLHPTPAVGGVPTADALAAIRTQEPFDRGWYAGPVGWIEPGAAEFAVAIRSGVVRDSRLALFSGAGIVDGSVPEREWDEIEQKIGDFAAVLGLVGHRNGARSS